MGSDLVPCFKGNKESATTTTTTKLHSALNGIARCLTFLQHQSTHVQKRYQSIQFKAVQYYKDGDMKMAQQYVRRYLHEKRLLDCILQLQAKIIALEYQVRTTHVITEALQGFHAFAELGDYLDRLTRDYNLEHLLEQVQQNSNRLEEIHEDMDELAEAALPPGLAMSEDDIVRELESMLQTPVQQMPDDTENQLSLNTVIASKKRVKKSSGKKKMLAEDIETHPLIDGD